jgi:hypothetical protein
VDLPLLGVGGLLRPDPILEVELFEPCLAHLAQARAGQQAHADDRGAALIRRRGQSSGQGGDLFWR